MNAPLPGERPEEKKPSPSDLERERALKAARLEALREKLYERGQSEKHFTRHSLKDTEGRIYEPVFKPQETKEEVQSPAITATSRAQFTPQSIQEGMKETNEKEEPLFIPEKVRSRTYRFKIIVGGILFFLATLFFASFFLFFGNNTISGENITIAVSGPLAVGGGEKLDFQVAVSNQNTVPIESATLIVRYPQGAQAVGEDGKIVTTMRQDIPKIGSGELLNIPMSVVLFGEENQEKPIDVTIEYHVAGSNAVFHKEAQPYVVRIGSTPIILEFDGLKRISTGQDMLMTLKVRSNSTETIKDLLIKASYPVGFEYRYADPEPTGSFDEWRISSLKPGEEKVITLKGAFNGKENEEQEIGFSAGIGDTSGNLISVLGGTTNEVVIEPPFLSADIIINGSRENEIIMSPDDTASIQITVTNILDTTVYDGLVEVTLQGNALDEIRVTSPSGFYDSTRNIATWDAVGVPALREIKPGDSGVVTLTLSPRTQLLRMPEIGLSVTVQGQRTSEDRVPQILAGTKTRQIKISSKPFFTQSVVYSTGPYQNTGPTPPIAERTTEYTYHFSIHAGTNDITGAELTAVVPQYIKWLGNVSNGENVTYDARTRTLRWDAGGINAYDEKEVWVQVAFLPSLSQVGKTPVLLEIPQFKAVDRFTGTSISSQGREMSTELFNEPLPARRSGIIQIE